MAEKKPRTPVVPRDGLVRRLIDKHKQASKEPEGRVLLKTAEKLVRYGRQVGVLPQDMISLLDDDISIGELLAFLASRTSGAA